MEKALKPWCTQRLKSLELRFKSRPGDYKEPSGRERSPQKRGGWKQKFLEPQGGGKVDFMTILVNGKEMELKAIGKNGIEWTNDLLGNYDALHYDEEQDAYTMTEDEFAWWEPVVEMLKAEYWPSDLDDEARARLEWLKSHTA